MTKFTELVTNADGRLSTTTSIQFFGAALMSLILVYSVFMDRSYVTELFAIFAFFCGGVATKGAVSALQRRGVEK